MITIKTNMGQVAKELEKIRHQIEKTSLNKAIASAGREAATVLRDTYSLPRYGENPPPKYGPPAISAQIKVEKIKTVGGLRAGVTAKVFSVANALGLVRFVPGSPPPVKGQRGVPVRQRQPYWAKFGGTPRSLGSAFVQRAHNATQAFRKVRFGGRDHEIFVKQSLPSAHEVLSRPENMRRMKVAAAEAFKKAVIDALKRRVG